MSTHEGNPNVRLRLLRHRGCHRGVAPARLEAAVVQRDRAVPERGTRAPTPVRPEPRRHDHPPRPHPVGRDRGPRRPRRGDALSVVLRGRTAPRPRRPAGPTDPHLRGDPRCHRLRPTRRPRSRRLGERPRRPLRRRQRLRQLPRRPRGRGQRAGPTREKVVGRWCCAGTPPTRGVASPGRPVLRPGPTTPSCVPCRQFSNRTRSRRGTSCRAGRATGFSAAPRSGAGNYPRCSRPHCGRW